MVSDLPWKRDANGIEHPVDESLLAFIRGQCAEHEKRRVSGHLLAGCVSCNQLNSRLLQSNNTLNHLKHMSRYLYYPELKPEQVLAHARRGVPLTGAWTG